LSKLRLSLAIGDYDHVRDLIDGVVQAEGIDLIRLNLPVEEIFYRFTKFREWDTSEMSMANYSAMVAHDDRSLCAIPVLPSRGPVPL
jgi:4,5-dihydroxyphthalate decarboxylase